MSNLSREFKQQIADLYLTQRKRLEEQDADTIHSFASKVLEFIEEAKTGSQNPHDLQVLGENMEHLRDDSQVIRDAKPETDEYDFALNDCKNLIFIRTKISK